MHRGCIRRRRRGASRVELYDVTKDRMELNNLAGQQPDIVKRLSQLDWQATLPEGPIQPAAGKINYGWPKSPTQAR